MTIFLLAAAFFAPAVGLLSRLFRVAYILLSVIVIFKTHSLTGWLLLGFLVSLCLRPASGRAVPQEG